MCHRAPIKTRFGLPVIYLDTCRRPSINITQDLTQMSSLLSTLTNVLTDIRNNNKLYLKSKGQVGFQSFLQQLVYISCNIYISLNGLLKSLARLHIVCNSKEPDALNVLPSALNTLKTFQ